MASFPFDKETWDCIILRINEKITEENDAEVAEKLKKSVQDIINSENGAINSAGAPYPRAPIFTRKMSLEKKVDTVQTYLNQLQYNHTGMSGYVGVCRGPLIRIPLPLKRDNDLLSEVNVG